MKKITNILLILSTTLIFIMLLSVKSLASTTGIITEVTVNVRKEASTDAKVIMYVTQDDKVEVLEKSGDWYKIKYKNKEGYVYADFIKVDEAISETTKNSEENKITESSEVEKPSESVEAKLEVINETKIKITPNILSSDIYTLKAGQEIKVLEQISGWSYISADKVSGWVRSDAIHETKAEETKTTTEEEKTEEKQEIAYIKFNSVNLRKEPSTDSSIIEKLKINTEVIVLEEVDSVWNKVKVNDNIGYVSKDLISAEKQEESKEEDSNSTTTSRDGESIEREEQKEETKTEETKNENTNQNNSSTSTSGQKVVEYAMQYKGYKYVYGGTSPQKGFDCSGFTSYVYKNFGYSLSRSSGGQANNGTRVEKKDLQPGDLVIYKNQSLTKIGHVGIYIGNNKMIHASEPGVGVTITDIDSKAHKYPQRFVMGRRIIK